MVPLITASANLPAEDVPPSPEPSASAPAVKKTAPKKKAPTTVSSAATDSTPAPSSSIAVISSGSAPSAGSAPPAPSAPPAASDPAALALAQRTDAFYVPRKSLSARFKQEFYIRSSGTKKNSSGVMNFERPGKMSWRYDPPNGNRVVSDGAMVRVYDADSQQYTEQPIANSEYPGALGFLTGDGIAGHFSFAFHDKVTFPGGKVLLGTPLRPNPWYRSVLFYIDEATAHIRRVVIIDAQGNRNRFDFDTLSEGPVAPSEFVWTPPAGATRIAR